MSRISEGTRDKLVLAILRYRVSVRSKNGIPARKLSCGPNSSSRIRWVDLILLSLSRQVVSRSRISLALLNAISVLMESMHEKTIVITQEEGMPQDQTPRLRFERVDRVGSINSF